MSVMATKSFLLRGWNKDKSVIQLIVDAEQAAAAFSFAKKLYPDTTFAQSEENRFKEPVPEAAKNILFDNNKDLYAAVPELNPQRRRRRS
jgi:hypothetical protein